MPAGVLHRLGGGQAGAHIHLLAQVALHRLAVGCGGRQKDRGADGQWAGGWWAQDGLASACSITPTRAFTVD